MIKSLLRSAANRVLPGVMNARYLRQATPLEREIAFLPTLIPAGSLVIDIGANRGLFIHHALKYTDKVVAFEPLPPMLAWLRRNYGQSIRLEPVALSDQVGSAEIRFPAGSHSLATIAASNHLELAKAPIEQITVPLRTLDSYAFDGVGFIKVDVEGHEAAVLRGAEQTLKRCLPNLLIEIEERHSDGATALVPEWLARLGYEGFFLDEGRLRPVRQFDRSTDQNKDNIPKGRKSGRYINNFMFSARADVIAALKA